MRSASYDDFTPPRGSLPRWALWAAVPLVLALGFISGIALSTYWPEAPAATALQPEGQNEAQAPAGQSGATAPPPTPASSQPAVPEQVDSTPREFPQDSRLAYSTPLLPHAADEIPYPTASIHPAEPGDRADSASGPPIGAAPAQVRTVVDARAALDTEFGSFRAGGSQRFTVDYQIARDINYNTVLIGIIKIAEYSQWVRAATDYPSELSTWLESAAERVKPAAQNEKFTLTWTIYEKVTETPYGFNASEVVRDPRGGFVVTRPLAAVTDVARSDVTISAAGLSRPTTSDTPWATYGPVIRFDPTDIYRPTRSTP